MKRLLLTSTFIASGIFVFAESAYAVCDESSEPDQITYTDKDYNPGFGAWVLTKVSANGNSSDCEDHVTDIVSGSSGLTKLSKASSIQRVQRDKTYTHPSIGDYDIPIIAEVNANAIINNVSVTAGVYEYGYQSGALSNVSADLLDVLRIYNPAATSPTYVNPPIPVKYCSTFKSETNGTAYGTGGFVRMFSYHTYEDAFEHRFYDQLVLDDDIDHTAVGEICETGYLQMEGRHAHMNFKLTADTLGVYSTENRIVGYTGIGTPVVHSVNIREGELTQTFEFGPMPDGFECYSKSGKFPGCEKMPDEFLNCSASGGNPIDFALGVKHQTEKDYNGGLLSLSRMYRSDAQNDSGMMGQNWRHNFERNASIRVTPESTTALISNLDGSGYVFFKDGVTDEWEADFGVTGRFEEVMDGMTHVGYLHITSDQTREYYDLDGFITRIEYRGGEALDFTHDGSDRLSTVTNEQGKSLTFTYNVSNQISSIVTPTGTFSYTYDIHDNLLTVTRPDSEVRTYHYEDTNFVNALTGITDEENVRFATWAYDSEGRAVSSEHADGVNSFDITYNADDTVTTTNALGKETIYTFANINGERMVTHVDGVASANCAAANQSKTYTSEGWLESETDWNDNTTAYSYDSNGLETERTEDVGGTAERSITTTHDTTHRLPDIVSENGLSTDYDYDSDGRMTSMTVTDTNTSEARTTTYSYYANSTDANGNTVLGKLYQVNGPRTDVSDITTYTYDGNFRLITVENALGHETNTTSFDSSNRPLSTEDANGVETTFVYDSLGRVTSMTVASGTPSAATTSYTYDDNGQVLTITLPNGVVTTNSYDDAGRLTGIEDDMGNTITYTLDDAGNITKEEYKDSGAALKFTLSQAYDELSRIIESVDANLDSTAYAYDLNSNQVSMTDGEMNATSYAFDGLDRMISQTDALSGVTSYDLNDLDQNEGTTDARGNETTYSYNAFGDITQELSPDRGTITYTHDKAGNVTGMTDARGVVSNYSYDALNRLTDIAYPSDSTLDVSLTYDSISGCGASIGRLCSVDDASGVTEYVYDDLGRLTSVTETRGALSFTTSYGYDLAGVLTEITLPSGRVIDYTLNDNAQISAVAAEINSVSTSLVSAVSYLPFGPVASMTYGNAITLSNTHNTAYQITNRTIGSLMNDNFTYDDAGNITVKGADSYTLDDLYRITGENTDTYSYDAIGNRLTKNSDDYTYPGTNSKLSDVEGSGVTYDAAGNIIDDTAREYTHDAANRLESVEISSSTVGEYVYNASNLRTAKTVGGVTTHYVYGMGGLLYGEYDSSGNMIREYIYLNGEPIAQIDDVSSSDVVTYLHTDHLGTPRYGTDSTGTQVWSWDSDAFGVGTPTGSVDVNLRFAGQYFDAESGLHYNWNRYYNPATGRYITSDPIGLDGGINTYAYAMANPIMFIDPEGLAVFYGSMRTYSVGTGADAIWATLWLHTNDNLSTAELPCIDIRVDLLGFGVSLGGPASRTYDYVRIDTGRGNYDINALAGHWTFVGGGVRSKDRGGDYGTLRINGYEVETLEDKKKGNIQATFASGSAGASSVTILGRKRHNPLP